MDSAFERPVLLCLGMCAAFFSLAVESPEGCDCTQGWNLAGLISRLIVSFLLLILELKIAQ